MLRNPRLSRWKHLPATEGLLLFAQRLEEMLFDYSLDSYKAPALNTLTRCTELLRTITDVQTGLIRQKTLNPMVEELAFSVANDTAAKAVAQPHAHDFARFTWWDTASPPRLEVQAQLFRSLLWKRAYEREIIKQLRAAISVGKQKALISDLSASLVVEWIRQGFSRDYIFLKTRTLFFGVGQPAIQDPEAAFDEFVAFFEPKKHKFDVCLKGHKVVSGLGHILPESVGTISDTAPEPRSGRVKERLFLESAHDGVYITFRGIEAYDARSARDQGFAVLTNISTIAAFHVHRTPFTIDREALVWHDDHPTVLRPPALAIHKHDECSVSELPLRFGNTIDALMPARVGDAAWGRLRAALGLHSSALASDDVPVQLTTLWAALEAIVPSPLDESRIQTVSDTLGPVLTLGYAKKIISDLHHSLMRCIGGEYNRVCSDAGFTEEGYLGCAALMLSSGRRSSRTYTHICIRLSTLLRIRTVPRLTQ